MIYMYILLMTLCYFYYLYYFCMYFWSAWCMSCSVCMEDGTCILWSASPFSLCFLPLGVPSAFCHACWSACLFSPCLLLTQMQHFYAWVYHINPSSVIACDCGVPSGMLWPVLYVPACLECLECLCLSFCLFCFFSTILECLPCNNFLYATTIASRAFCFWCFYGGGRVLGGLPCYSAFFLAACCEPCLYSPSDSFCYNPSLVQLPECPWRIHMPLGVLVTWNACSQPAFCLLLLPANANYICLYVPVGSAFHICIICWNIAGVLMLLLPYILPCSVYYVCYYSGVWNYFCIFSVPSVPCIYHIPVSM